MTAKLTTEIEVFHKVAIENNVGYLRFLSFLTLKIQSTSKYGQYAYISTTISTYRSKTKSVFQKKELKNVLVDIEKMQQRT